MVSNHKRGVGEEHPNGHIIQLSAAIIFFLIWILDSFVFMVTIFIARYIPFSLRIILFLSFLVLGFFLIFRSGHLLFHKEDTPSKLIKTGLYAHIRHPLYLGVLLIYLGFVIFSVSLISIFGFIIVFILYNWIATFEERDLEKLFQQEYLEYKKKVNKWIPFI
ncbi:MAG: methyltransferase family protein [Promethearchaeota archaeon]